MPTRTPQARPPSFVCNSYLNGELLRRGSPIMIVRTQTAFDLIDTLVPLLVFGSLGREDWITAESL